MTTMSILRNALKLNAKEINVQQNAVTYHKQEAIAWRKQGELAFSVAAYEDVKRHRASLAKLVTMQRKMKVEVHAIERNERIARKYEFVFGKPPVVQSKTSYEMEDMLDVLVSEKLARDMGLAEAVA